MRNEIYTHQKFISQSSVKASHVYLINSLTVVNNQIISCFTKGDSTINQLVYDFYKTLDDVNEIRVVFFRYK